MAAIENVYMGRRTRLFLLDIQRRLSAKAIPFNSHLFSISIGRFDTLNKNLVC